MKKIVFSLIIVISTTLMSTAIYAKECSLTDCLAPNTAECAQKCDTNCHCFSKFKHEGKWDGYFNYKVCRKPEGVVLDTFYYGRWYVPRSSQKYFYPGKKGKYRVDVHGRIEFDGKYIVHPENYLKDSP